MPLQSQPGAEERAKDLEARRQEIRLTEVSAIIDTGDDRIFYVGVRDVHTFAPKGFLEGLASNNLVDPTAPGLEELKERAAETSTSTFTQDYHSVYETLQSDREREVFVGYYEFIINAKDLLSFLIVIGAGDDRALLSLPDALSKNEDCLPEPARNLLVKLCWHHRAYLGFSEEELREEARKRTLEGEEGLYLDRLTFESLLASIENGPASAFQTSIIRGDTRWFIPTMTAIAYAARVQDEGSQITPMQAKELRLACIKKMRESGQKEGAVQADKVSSARVKEFSAGRDLHDASERAKELTEIIMAASSADEIDQAVRSTSQGEYASLYEHNPISDLIAAEASEDLLTQEEAVPLFYLYLEKIVDFDVAPSQQDCVEMIESFSTVHGLSNEDVAFLVSAISADEAEFFRNLDQLTGDRGIEATRIMPQPSIGGIQRRARRLALASALLTLGLIGAGAGLVIHSLNNDPLPLKIEPLNSRIGTPESQKLPIARKGKALDKEATLLVWESFGIKVLKFDTYEEKSWWITLRVDGATYSGLVPVDDLDGAEIIIKKSTQ
jgi:hypothetical protein